MLKHKDVIVSRELCNCT